MFYLIDNNIPLLEKHLSYVEKEMKTYIKDLGESYKFIIWCTAQYNYYLIVMNQYRIYYL